MVGGKGGGLYYLEKDGKVGAVEKVVGSFVFVFMLKTK